MADVYDKKGSNYLPAIMGGFDFVGGGKFFSGKSGPKMVMEGGEWVYYNTFVVSLGQRVGTNPVSIARIWANDILIVDRYEGIRMPGFNYQFFPGDEDQGEVYRGMNYRGLMTLLITEMPLDKFGNNIPNISVDLVEGVSGTDDVAGPLPFAGNWGFNPYTVPNHLEISPDGQLRAVTTGWPIISVITPFTQSLTCFDTVNMDTKSMGAKVFSSFFEQSILDPEATSFDETVFAYLPNNLCLVQMNKFKATRYLFDMTSGLMVDYWGGNLVSANTDVDFVPWNVALGFQLPTENLIDGFVIGASSSGEWGILSAKGGALRYAYGLAQEFADPLQCFTRAGLDGASAQIVATFAGQLDLIKVGRIGTGGGYQATVEVTGLYNHVDTGELYQTFYSPSDNTLVLLVITDAGTRAGYARKISMSGVVQWTSIPFVLPPFYAARQRTMEATSILDNNMLVLKRGAVANGVTVLFLDTGAIETKTITPGTFAVGGITVWNANNGTLYGLTKTPYRMVALPDGEAADILVEDFVQGLAVMAGYDEADFEASGIGTMSMGGYVISSGASFQQVVNGIGQLYGFSWLERTDKIVVSYNYDEDGIFSPDMVIPADDIAVLTENANSGELMSVLAATSEFPKALSVSYNSVANDFAVVPQSMSRSDFPVATQASEGRLDIKIPITLDDAKASALLYNMAFRLWAARISYEVRLPVEYIKLDAGDGIEFTAEGYTYQASVVSHRFNVDKSVTLSLTEATGAFYPVEDLVALQPSLRGPNKNQSNGIRLVVLDIPDFHAGMSTPDTLALTVIVAGFEPDTFGGCRVTLTRASEPTVATQFLDFAATEGGYVGTLLSDISVPVNPFVLDEVTELVLDLGSIPEDRFENIDDADIEATQTNLVAVTNNGYTELVAFGQFEDGPEPGTIKLTRLLRGRFGTEQFMRYILPGATVAFLDNSKRGVYPATDFNRASTVPETFILNTESAGLISSAASVTVKPQGYSRKPYAPINIEVTRAGAGEDIEIMWSTRPRFANYPPNVLLDFYPPTEEYLSAAVEIWSENGERAVRREYTDDGYFIYTEAMQVADGFSPFDITHLSFLIYQMASDTLGMGIPGGGKVEIATPGQLFISIDGGGEIEIPAAQEAAAPGELYVVIDGGGEIEIEPDLQGYIFASIDGGGEIKTTLSVGGELRITIDGGGEIETEIPFPAFKHRYWRIRTYDNQGGSGNTAIVELEMYERFGGPNECHGGFAAASSVVSAVVPFAAARAFDRSYATFGANSANQDLWAGTTKAEWLSYDFGSGNEKEIVGVGIAGREAAFISQMPKTFDIEYSDDNATWTTAWSVANIGTWAAYDFKTSYKPSYVPSISGSPYGAHAYWRLVLLDNSSGNDTHAFAELDFRATVGGADQCTGGTPLASSSFAGLPIANGFDNNNATLWSSAASTQIANVQYAFLTAVEVAEVFMRSRADTAATTSPAKFLVQFSDNPAVSWTTAWQASPGNTWSLAQNRTFADPGYSNPIAGAPVVRSFSVATEPDGSGGTLSFPKPVGLAVDDLLAVAISTVNLYANDTPSGWTRHVDANGAAQCLTKLADAGDVAATTIDLTFSAYTAKGAAGVMVAIKGVDTAAPVEDAAVSTGAGGVAPVSPSVTAGAASRLLIAMTMNPAYAALSAPTSMSMVGHAEFVSVFGAPQGAAAAIAQQQLGVATGATGTRTWGSSFPASGTHSYSLIIKGP